MIHSRLHSGARQGAIAPLTAILLIPLLGMVAFAVDLGWISLTQSDLQNAADSAALAAAGQLTDGYVQYNLPGQTALQQSTILSASKSNAKTYAKNFAGYNAAGGTTLSSVLDADVQFGVTDASGNYTTPGTGFPNTVKVTVRRDATANGSLGLFFGPVLGLSSVDLKASAAATVYAINVDSFSSTTNLPIGMLPFTYDINNWNNYLATGANPDGNISTDSSGNPDISIYPSVKDTGNFGELSIDGSHAGASTISGWIDSGMSSSDVQNLQSVSAGDQTPIIPLSQHNSTILPSASTDGMGSWNWVGNPGMKTSTLHTAANHVGETFLLPLFTPLNANAASYAAGNGGGSHYYYNIVQFVAVKIIYVDNKSLVVEPSAMVLNLDTVTLGGAATPAGWKSPGVSTTSQTTFAPPKLSQ